MVIRDLTKKDHWDGLYSEGLGKRTNTWIPKSYLSQVIDFILVKAISSNNPETILEIGCGNSSALPFAAKTANAKVTGIDYSEDGCQLARQRLEMESLTGTIICDDVFHVDHETVGQYDLVYSLGVVEHYSDLTGILREELRFVKPGGILLTEVPNLQHSIHGLLSEIYQPELYAKFDKVSKNQLIDAYTELGLTNIKADYAGLFTLGIVAWGKYPRWKFLSAIIVPFILIMGFGIDFILSKINCFRGCAFFAPYIYIIGTKK